MNVLYPELTHKDHQRISHWIWMIETQINEIREHIEKQHPKRKIANEYADIVSIVIQAIDELGYDSYDIITDRKLDIEQRIAVVAKKYSKMWKEFNDKNERVHTGYCYQGKR